MKYFLELNKWKLKYAFIATSIVFTTIVLGIFIYAYSVGQQQPELSLLIAVFFGAGIVSPLFVLLIGTLRGTWDLNKRRKAFNKEPFGQLKQYGFSEILKNESNKWQFSEPILKGKIENYEILAEVDTQYAPDVIRFQALTKVEPKGKEEVKRLSRKFEPYDIQLDYDRVTKQISIKDERINSISQLITELNNFISIIQREKFAPK